MDVLSTYSRFLRIGYPDGREVFIDVDSVDVVEVDEGGIKVTAGGKEVAIGGIDLPTFKAAFDSARSAS